MNRRSNWLVGTLLTLAAVPIAVAADPPEMKLVPVDGKTVVVESGGGGFGGGFQRDRSIRLNLRPTTGKLEKGAFLGITATPVTAALRSQLKLQPGVGLVVESVEKDSPAAAAGIEQYDILQQLNDQILIDPHQFGVLVRLAKPGDEVALKVVRKGDPMTVKAKVVEKDLPPLDAEAGWSGAIGGFSPGDRIMIDRSEEPMNRAMEFFRKNRDVAGQFSYADKGMTLQITQQDGRRQLLAKDAAGKVLYNGPINTDENWKALPPEVAKRLKAMDATTRPSSGE